MCKLKFFIMFGDFSTGISSDTLSAPFSLFSSFGTPIMSNTGHVSKENSPLNCGKFSGRGQETRRGLKVEMMNKLSGL